jgi:hypothetical protein
VTVLLRMKSVGCGVRLQISGGSGHHLIIVILIIFYNEF